MPSSTHHFLYRGIIIKTVACRRKKKRNAASEKDRERRFPIHASARIRMKRKRTLQHVDIIELQAFQALLHRVKDVLPALATLVHVAEAVGILRTPEEFPRITAKSEV
jgi:glycine/D-amino acid oxidase-like deaminating enzyme